MSMLLGIREVNALDFDQIPRCSKQGSSSLSRWHYIQAGPLGHNLYLLRMLPWFKQSPSFIIFTQLTAHTHFNFSFHSICSWKELHNHDYTLIASQVFNSHIFPEFELNFGIIVPLPPQFMLNIHDPPTPIPRDGSQCVPLFSHSFYMPIETQYLSFGAAYYINP